MNSTEFELQHADVKQSTLLDEDCVTRDWPMPEPRKWEPRPQVDEQAGMWGASVVSSTEYQADQKRRTNEMREALVRAPRPDPADEKNPIAASFTHFMYWARN